MSEDIVRLFFPQWQGSGDSNDLYFSAIEIYDLHLKENEIRSLVDLWLRMKQHFSDKVGLL